MNCPKCNHPMQFDIELDYGEHSPFYCIKCGYAEGCNQFFNEIECNHCTEYVYCKKWFDIQNGDLDTNVSRCRHCGKKSTEIQEYIDSAKYEETDPETYVRREEGTYDRASKTFICTACYVKTLMP
jgi:hypothetical protein